MSMNHKAYVFKYNEFNIELLPVLVNSLRENNSEKLIHFINNNVDYLTNIYNYDSLNPDWASEFNQEDVQICGDIALTKYYDLSDDLGLGGEWDFIFDTLKNCGLDAQKLTLGSVIGDKEKFDPGLMGSFFQSTEDILFNKEIIKNYSERNKYLDIFTDLENIFNTAYSNKSGLYITF